MEREGGRRCRPLDRWAACTLMALGHGCREVETSPLAPSYGEARAVVQGHCSSCHSEHPTIPAFPIAPSGVVFDSVEQMQRYAERIRVRTVLDRTMPLLNKTRMSNEERAILGRWVESGANGP